MKIVTVYFNDAEYASLQRRVSKSPEKKESTFIKSSALGYRNKRKATAPNSTIEDSILLATIHNRIGSMLDDARAGKDVTLDLKECLDLTGARIG